MQCVWKCMSSNKKTKNRWKDTAYGFGFANKDGIVDGYHMSDNLHDGITWESVEFKFSGPSSQYLIVWRRDNQNMTEEEIQHLVDYVVEDMEDYTSEGTETGVGTWTKLLHMTSPSKEYLIMAYDKLTIPEQHDSWEEFASNVFDDVYDRVEEGTKHEGYDEKIEKVLNDGIPDKLEKYR